MIANTVLVRWHGGWWEVKDQASIDEIGRHELLLGLGAAQSVAEVERIANAMLAIYGRPRIEIAAGYQPQTTADVPYLAYLVGDTILVPAEDGAPARERVMALTVNEDDNGYLSYAPELKDVIMATAERYETAIKKMVDGTGGGQIKAATPASMVAVSNEPTCCPPTPVIQGPVG